MKTSQEPHIAPIFAPICGKPITRGAFVPKNIEYKVCSSCVMDTTVPNIQFDMEGICHYCNNFKSAKNSQKFSEIYRKHQLATMLQKIKGNSRKNNYDCIIGLSGGVDSSFLALKVAEWGLRPLVLHVDAGWNSELAVMNIEQICKSLGFDLVTHVVDWAEMRDLQLAFLRSGVANQDIPQDHAIFAALYKYAKKVKIKNVINGSNYATESVLPETWGHDAMDSKQLIGIHKQFGTMKLKTFPVLNFLDFNINFKFFGGMRVHNPLNFVDYNKKEAIKFLERDFGWRYYDGKHFESRWTKFFQAYYLPYRFGYDKRKAHLSSLILSKQMTRGEAFERLKVPLYNDVDLKSDKIFIAKKLQISLVELDNLISLPLRHFSEFPNYQLQRQLAIRCFSIITNPLDSWKTRKEAP